MAPTQQQAKSAKTKQLAGSKAPKARVQRYLKSTEPQLREGGKSTLLLKGIRCSSGMGQVLQELRALAAPNAKLLSKKNQIVAFDVDGQQSLEFLATKNDCALVAIASHNKKRPNHIVLARTFDHRILDLVELAILKFKSMKDYGGSVPKKRIGSKPLLLFAGDVWQQDRNMRNLQNLLVDFYRGDVVDKLVVSGVDHIITFTAGNAPGLQAPLIHQRTYFCKLKKDPAGGNTPMPYLLPCGPDTDFQLRRTQWADADLYKASRKQPTSLRKKKVKNQSTNLFGETIGRLHLERQDVEHMQGRKVKALRRAEKISADADKAEIELELEREKKAESKEVVQTLGFDPEAENSSAKATGKGRKRKQK
jgi:ribosome production factor 2